MPLRPCAEPTCPRPAAPGKSRCDEHRREYERERSRRRRQAGNAKRDYRVKVHHTAKWVNTSRRARFENPICQKCGEHISERQTLDLFFVDGSRHQHSVPQQTILVRIGRAADTGRQRAFHIRRATPPKLCITHLASKWVLGPGANGGYSVEV